MMYAGKCPHCKAVVRSGNGSPWKRIDTPLRTCPRCFRPYIDDNMYEWSVIGIGYKLWFYFFANNRFIPWFILACAAYRSWLYLLFGGIAWMIFCFLWVSITKKDQIAESKRRTAYNPEYLKTLSDCGYDKLATKYDQFYTERVPSFQNIGPVRENCQDEDKKTHFYVCKNCGKQLTALHTRCDSCGGTIVII